MIQLAIMPFVVKFVILVILATLAASQEHCARTYTVQLGDVCDAISAAQHVSTFQLANVNPLIDALCDNLTSGEILCLGVIGQDCNITTVMHPGDTCQTIATKANINREVLLKNNPNVNSTCANIYPGEVLCTANKVFVKS